MKATSVLAASGSILVASAAQAQWGMSGSRVYYVGGNVGIGTANPAYPLHVRTTSSARGLTAENMTSTGAAFGVWGQSASTSGRGVFGWATRGTGTTYGVQGQSASTSGRGVLGWASAPTGKTCGVFGLVASPDGYAGYFEGGRNYFSGRVGIGTPDPAEMLHVNGNIRMPNNAVIGGVVANYNGGSLTIQAPGNATSHGTAWGGGELRLRAGACNSSWSSPPPAGTSNGNDVVIQAGDNVYGGLGNGILNGNIRFIAGDAQFNGGTQPERMRIVGDTGNVGIGTTSPGSFRLAVNGSAAKAGGGSWATFSDARLKTNIEPMRGTLDRLLSLRGYTFNYLPEAVEQRLALPGTQIGLLAQEVEAVFPDWVSEDAEGYKYVTERGTTAIMVEALRDLRVETDRVRAENAELRARLDRLEEQLASLAQPR